MKLLAIVGIAAFIIYILWYSSGYDKRDHNDIED